MRYRVRKAYVEVAHTGEHVNVEIYPPLEGGRPSWSAACPVIIIAAGGGGKDLRTGGPATGKYAAAYHDLAVSLAAAGFFVLVPSRRGDPQRTPFLRDGVSREFADRLPTELFEDEGPN